MDDQEKLEDTKQAGDGNQALTARIGELEKLVADGQAKMRTLSVEAAVKLTAAREKAKDPADVLKLIDTGALTVGDDGTVAGLEEQFKALRESKPYLFGGDGSVKGGGDLNGGNRPADLDTQIAEAQNRGDIALSIALKNRKAGVP